MDATSLLEAVNSAAHRILHPDRHDAIREELRLCKPKHRVQGSEQNQRNQQHQPVPHQALSRRKIRVLVPPHPLV
jgi:hypothetical protein